MIGHEAPRALMISPADGSKVKFERTRVHVKQDAEKVAADHYGGNPVEAIGRGYETDADLATGYFAMARAEIVVTEGPVLHQNSVLRQFRRQGESSIRSMS